MNLGAAGGCAKERRPGPAASGSTVSGPVLAAGTLCLQDLQPLCLYLPLKGEAAVGQAAEVRGKATAIPAEAHSKVQKLWQQAALASQAMCPTTE